MHASTLLKTSASVTTEHDAGTAIRAMWSTATDNFRGRESDVHQWRAIAPLLQTRSQKKERKEKRKEKTTKLIICLFFTVFFIGKDRSVESCAFPCTNVCRPSCHHRLTYIPPESGLRGERDVHYSEILKVPKPEIACNHHHNY